MDYKPHFESKVLSIIISLYLIFVPLFGELSNIIVDEVNGNETYTDVTQNGVDLVNISAPSEAGVSQNMFDKYNVNEGGVILNNSNDMDVSVLGGAVYGNPNFTGDEADIILNEVTGSDISNLLGYTEIFGKSAEFILANPNGIYVNGAGFINTPRVTLTTGSPDVLSGDLLGFDIQKGEINIGDMGIDVSESDYFDILSKTVKLTGTIWGDDEVNIIAGSNYYDYKTKEIVENGNGEKPEISIDASLLGSIYAGRINIISTDDGVGVNTSSSLYADVGDISINSDGSIKYVDISAKGEVHIQGVDIEQKGVISAEGNVRISAEENIVVGKKLL